MESLPKLFCSLTNCCFLFGSGDENSENDEDENKFQKILCHSQQVNVLNPTDKHVATAIAAAAALPVVDLPIARDGLTENHFIVPNRRAFLEAQARDTKVQLLRSLRQRAKTPTLDELAGESTRLE